MPVFALDDIIGNEILDVTNGTLIRSGVGSTIDPYTVKINLNNANTWTASQKFTTNVGIGTTVPVNMLDVGGALAIGSYAGRYTAPSNGVIISGNVGIGTTSVTDFLKIDGALGGSGITLDSSTGAGINLDRGATTNISAVKHYTAGTEYWRVGMISNSTNTYNISDGSNNPFLTVVDNGTTGNVGIGVTYPGERLDVAGGNGRVQSGYNWLTSSDRRYKTNVTTLSDSLEKLLQLRGVRYDLKADQNVQLNKGKLIGFIAQELELFYPELVVADSSGMKAVAYDKMTAVLVEAIKEQQQEIDLLKQQVKLLQENR